MYVCMYIYTHNLRLLRPTGSPIKISDDVLLGMKRARGLVKTVLAGSADAKPEVLEQLVLAKRSLLVNFDSTFVIELQLLKEMQAEGGVSFIKQTIEDLMPRADNAQVKGLSIKYEALKALKLWPVWKFLNEQAQSCLTEILRYMDDMKLGTTPDVATMRRDPFLSRMLGSFENFCVWDLNAAAAAAAKAKASSSKAASAIKANFVVGKPAFDKYLTAAQTMEKCKEVTLDDMDPLHVYIWLADDKQKTEIQRIAAVIYGAATGTAKKKAAKNPVASKKAKVEVQEDDPLAELFK